MLIRQGYPPIGVVAVATLGNYLGACTTYWLGRGAGRAMRRDAPPTEENRATRLIARYGAPALALSWVPIVGDAVVVAAGVARIPFLPFSLWTAGGKLLRYVVVAWGATAW